MRLSRTACKCKIHHASNAGGGSDCQRGFIQHWYNTMFSPERWFENAISSFPQISSQTICYIAHTHGHTDLWLHAEIVQLKPVGHLSKRMQCVLFLCLLKAKCFLRLTTFLKNESTKAIHSQAGQYKWPAGYDSLTDLSYTSWATPHSLWHRGQWRLKTEGVIAGTALLTHKQFLIAVIPLASKA